MNEKELCIQLFGIHKAIKQKTLDNKANGITRKGFSANSHNYKRSHTDYSLAERIFKDTLLHKKLTDWIHEHNIKVKDSLGKIHNYHLDFYFPNQRIAIEINPDFHYDYEPVVVCDKLRSQVLSRYGITVIGIHVNIRQLPHSQITTLDKSDVKNTLSLLRKLKDISSLETLSAY